MLCFWQDESVNIEKIQKAIIIHIFNFEIDKSFLEWSVCELINNLFLKLDYQSKTIKFYT